MPQQTTTPSPKEVEEYDFLRVAQDTFREHGMDFNVYFDTAFQEGVVYKDRDFFFIATVQNDYWLIWWAQGLPGKRMSPGELVRRCMSRAPFPMRRVAWARGLRGRKLLTYFDWNRMLRFTGTAHETIPEFPIFD